MDITFRSFVMLLRHSRVVSKKESVLSSSAAIASTSWQQRQSQRTFSAAAKLAIVVAKVSQKEIACLKINQARLTRDIQSICLRKK